jgi:hypothetical protein
MNTRGLVELIVLNVGLDRRHQAMCLSVLMALATTLASPLLLIGRPTQERRAPGSLYRRTGAHRLNCGRAARDALGFSSSVPARALISAGCGSPAALALARGDIVDAVCERR